MGKRWGHPPPNEWLDGKASEMVKQTKAPKAVPETSKEAERAYKRAVARNVAAAEAKLAAAQADLFAPPPPPPRKPLDLFVRAAAQLDFAALLKR